MKPKYLGIATMMGLGAAMVLCPAAWAGDGAQGGWWDSLGSSLSGRSAVPGDPVSESRGLQGFESIELNCSADLRVRVGESYSVTVTGDAAALPHVVTAVQDHRLVIETHGSFHSLRPLQVEVQVPSLRGLAVNGSGDVRLSGLSGGDLKMAVRGSGDILAAGRVDALAVSVQGSGDVHATDLDAVSATVAVAGSGDVDLSVSQALTVAINGSGDVIYHGNPTAVQRAINGSGDVIHR